MAVHSHYHNALTLPYFSEALTAAVANIITIDTTITVASAANLAVCLTG